MRLPMPRTKQSHVLRTDQHRNAQFLYRVVSQTLRERIANGPYQHGSRIPGVDELAKEFGVSTITVRRAIRDLTLEGMVIGRRGLGLFVASRPRIVRMLTAGLDPAGNKLAVAMPKYAMSQEDGEKISAHQPRAASNSQ